jgi:transcriptional regulator with XRE-family HTH domain
MSSPTHAQEALAFSERLRSALDRAGVRPSPTVVAHEFNLRYWGRPITPHTARNWLIGVSMPTQDKLRVLAQWLEAEPDQLRWGPSGQSRALREQGALEARLRHADLELLERYLGLPAEGQKTVREVVLALSKAFASQPPAQRPGKR